MNKFSEMKSYILALKSPVEIKSYHFETLFSRTFFWFQYDFIKKNVLVKSSILVENAWEL